MPNFRKKPVVISAQLITPEDDTSTQQIEKWFVDALISGTIETLPEGKLRVKTLEGDMIGIPGDYIIRRVAGELYPCKKEIFEQTYEAA